MNFPKSVEGEGDARGLGVVDSVAAPFMNLVVPRISLRTIGI